MTLIESTENYSISTDYMGSIEVIHKASKNSVYFQGDDARHFNKELEIINNKEDEGNYYELIDNLCSDYFND